MSIYPVCPADRPELERRLYDWAEEAGAVALRYFRRTGDLEFKSGKEAVTEADRRIETLLRERIAAAYPDDRVIGEEFGGSADDVPAGVRVWQIDPIDGTLNFALGLPEFCLSLAVLQDGDVLAGGVFQPISGDAFTASRGLGLRLNGQPVQVSDRAALADAILSPHLKNAGRVAADPALLQAVTTRPYKVRKMGAVALELAYLAVGWYDALLASFDQKICVWDVAAGILLVQEAGGRISGLTGGAYAFGDADLIASNGHVHDELVDLIDAYL